MLKPSQNFWAKFFGSRVVLVALLVLLLLVGWSILRQKKDSALVENDIKELEAEITTLENKSLELAEMIKYLRSDDFVEREAREKLNLKLPGEKVVIVPEGEVEIVAGAEYQKKKNWELWVDYFFGVH